MNTTGAEEPLRMTYYNYKCPNRIHEFTLINDVATCIHCYYANKVKELAQASKVTNG